MILCDMEAVVIAAMNAVPMLPETAREIEKAIRENVKQIEAEPVRHGRWIFRGKEFDTHILMCYCSECEFLDYRSNYCSHCGAKMDGGADNA